MLRRHTHLVSAVYCAISALTAIAPQSHGHGAYHDVVTEATRELALKPNDAALRFKLACAHEEHGEWTLALEELERLRRLDAQGFEIGFVQGKALATGAQWRAAKGALDEFLSTSPGHVDALAERGQVLLKLGETEAALVDFSAAVGTDRPLSPELYVLAATAFAEHSQSEQAIAILRKGLALVGGDPALLLPSLELELSAGNLAEALSRVDAMQKAAPRPEPWMARRAQVFTQAGKTQEARAAWTSLRDHLLSLPSLERGTPLLSQLLTEAQRALGEKNLAPVAAPPAPQ